MVKKTQNTMDSAGLPQEYKIQKGENLLRAGSRSMAKGFFNIFSGAIGKNQIAIGLVIVGVGLRVLPMFITGHLGNNFAPVGAIALFGGVYLNKKYALWLPLLIMMISDVFLGYHNLIFLTWGSFALIALIGLWVRNHKNIPNIIFGTVTGSLIFFFITNLGVWVATPMYSKTWAGLVQCYVMAVPFFRNTLASDLFYVGAFFGTYELAMYLVPKLQQQSVKENI